MLDPISHDMAYYNFDEQLVSDLDQIKQNLKIRLLLVKGEYFADSTQGNIDFNLLSTKKNIPDFIDAANKATIKDTQGVVSILSYTSNYNTQTRIMNISFSVQTIYGSATLNNVQVML